jgi:hypothetical protein
VLLNYLPGAKRFGYSRYCRRRKDFFVLCFHILKKQVNILSQWNRFGCLAFFWCFVSLSLSLLFGLAVMFSLMQSRPFVSLAIDCQVLD